MKQLVTYKDYYDLNPTSGQASGDIWSDLPTFGLLRCDHVTGLVITPACDLSNSKVETITYLPIIPIASYFSTAGFLPEVVRETERLLTAIGANTGFTADRFVPPSDSLLQVISDFLDRIADDSKRSAKDKAASLRALAGIRFLRDVGGIGVGSVRDLDNLFGRPSLNEFISKIVRNAYRLDVHFLPADEQPIEWSGIHEHSVALFRYAFTAPVRVFEAAHDVSVKDWAAAVASVRKMWPGATAFVGRRPMKRVALRPRFLSDLLTRYIAMYVRLGSPDFTRETVDAFIEKINGG